MKGGFVVPCAVVAALVLGLAGGRLRAQSATVAKPLADATVLTGVDGRLVHMDANDTWWFEFTAQVKSDTYEIPVGKRLRLLPSSTLERLIDDVNDRYTPSYRLSAQVTRYEGVNFLLMTYFLPLSKFKTDPGVQEDQPQVENETPAVPADPNLAIPSEIIERLKDRRPIRGPLRKPGESDPQSDSADRDYLGRRLVDRVGLIKPGNTGSASVAHACGFTLPRLYFAPYALGWNVGDVRYELLPSTALEEARQLQRRSLEPIRFNVAGLATQFRGTQYLLLQRAAPVYNYGNFGR